MPRSKRVAEFHQPSRQSLALRCAADSALMSDPVHQIKYNCGVLLYVSDSLQHLYAPTPALPLVRRAARTTGTDHRADEMADCVLCVCVCVCVHLFAARMHGAHADMCGAKISRRIGARQTLAVDQLDGQVRAPRPALHSMCHYPHRDGSAKLVLR